MIFEGIEWFLDRGGEGDIEVNVVKLIFCIL